MYSRRIVGAVVGGIIVIAAAVLVLSETQSFQIAGAVLIAVFVLSMFAFDWLDAWSNERHVEQNPHLLKNDAIGERVTVSGQFSGESGVATGLVVLGGETWKARCAGDYLPEDGEVLTVTAREGLTLYVQPGGSDV